MGRPRGTISHLELSGLTDKRPAYYGQRNNENFAIVTSQLEAPKKYSKETKEAWQLVVPNLLVMQVISEVDLPSLMTMFDCYEEYVQAKKAIAKYDKIHTIDEPDYILKRKALNTWLMNCQQNFNKIAARFGCMPTERSRLPINKQEPETVDALEVVLGN